jgi:hypothetical protein
MPDKAPNTDYIAKPTMRKPTEFAKKFEKNLAATTARHDVNLNEIDNMLTEKQGTLKRKIWDLSKMESLVHSDPKLEAIYQDMQREAEENQRYGYHWNEAVLNIMFNDYVLNSPKYLQKYKMAMPKEKKRRDKSGIKQLQRAGEKEMEKRGVDKEKLPSSKPKDVPEGYNHNNSLEGIMEYNKKLKENWEGDMSFEPTRQPVDQSNQRNYLNHRIERKYDTMREYDDEEDWDYDDTDYASAYYTDDPNDPEILKKIEFIKNNIEHHPNYEKIASPYKPEEMGELIDDLKYNSHRTINYLYDYISKKTNKTNKTMEGQLKEHHLNSREEQIDFILNYAGDKYSNDRLNMLPDEQIDDIYRSIERDVLGIEENIGIVEHHLDSREDKEKFIYKHTPHMVMGQIKTMSDEAIDNLYHQIEVDLGMVEPDQPVEKETDIDDVETDGPVDETTGSASSGAFTPALGYNKRKFVKEGEEEKVDETTTTSSAGDYAYVGPFGKRPKNHVANKPAWKGGEIIGENYLTESKLFENIYEYLEEDKDDPCWQGYEQYGMKEKGGKEVPNCVPNEGMNSGNNDSRVPIAEVDTSWIENDQYLPKSDQQSTELNQIAADAAAYIRKLSETEPEKLSVEDVGRYKLLTVQNWKMDKPLNVVIPKSGENKVGFSHNLGKIVLDVERSFPQIVDDLNVAISNSQGNVGVSEVIDEKSKSKSQQRFMGMVHAAQKGELDDPSPEVEKAAKSMSDKDAEDFASTKHKGLPEKVKSDEGVGSTVGGIVGGVAGGALGSRVAGGAGARVGSAIGSKVGSKVGSKFGESMALGKSEDPTTMAKTMQDVPAGGMGGSSMGGTFEGKELNEVEKLKRLVDFTEKYNLTPTGTNGKFKLSDLTPVLTNTQDKDDLYDLGLYFANRIIGQRTGLGWNDLPDTNSLWDYVEGHRDMKDFIESVKEAVDDRLSEEDYDMFGESINEDENKKPSGVKKTTKCRADEVPVPGKAPYEKGSCKKKSKFEKMTKPEEKERSPHNIESRKKRIAKQEKEMEKKKNTQKRELEKSKKELKEQMNMVFNVFYLQKEH